MTKVKVCGLRTSDAARVALQAGADMLGFVFYEGSHRCVDIAEARSIINLMRGEPTRGWQAVGVFVNEQPERVNDVARACGLDLAQLCGDEDQEYCRKLQVPYVKVLRPEVLVRSELARQTASFWGAQRILLDAHRDGLYGGTGAALHWSELRPIAGDTLLAGGLTPANVVQAIEQVRPWGVDVSSGVEENRLKSPDLIRAFLDEVRRADSRFPTVLQQ